MPFSHQGIKRKRCHAFTPPLSLPVRGTRWPYRILVVPRIFGQTCRRSRRTTTKNGSYRGMAIARQTSVRTRRTGQNPSRRVSFARVSTILGRYSPPSRPREYDGMSGGAGRRRPDEFQQKQEIPMFAELKTFFEIFQPRGDVRPLVIPDYQRSYDWEPEHRTALFNPHCPGGIEVAPPTGLLHGYISWCCVD